MKPNLFIAADTSENIPAKYKNDSFLYLKHLFSDLYCDNYEFNIVSQIAEGGILLDAIKIAQNRDNDIEFTFVYTESSESSELRVRSMKRYYWYSKFILAENTSKQTEEFFKLSDALLFLPGGIETMQQFFSAIDFKRKGEMDKPIIICNIDFYYDGLLAFLNKMCNESFEDKKVAADLFHVSYSAEDAAKYIRDYSSKTNN